MAPRAPNTPRQLVWVYVSWRGPPSMLRRPRVNWATPSAPTWYDVLALPATRVALVNGVTTPPAPPPHHAPNSACVKYGFMPALPNADPGAPQLTDQLPSGRPVSLSLDLPLEMNAPAAA